MGEFVILASCEHHFIRVHENLVHIHVVIYRFLGISFAFKIRCRSNDSISGCEYTLILTVTYMIRLLCIRKVKFKLYPTVRSINKLLCFGMDEF